MRFIPTHGLALVMSVFAFLPTFVSCAKDPCMQKAVPELLKASAKQPLGKRQSWVLQSLLKRCKRLPKEIRMLLEVPLPQGVGKTQAHSFINLFTETWWRRWKRMCPGHSKRVSVARPWERRLQRYLHSSCKGEGAKYISAQELEEGQYCTQSALFFEGAILYTWLMEVGVSRSMARRFVRESYLGSFGWRPYMPLSTTSYHVRFKLRTNILAKARGLLLNHKKVCAVHRGGIAAKHLKKSPGVTQALIRPLLKKLRSLSKKYQKFAKFNSSFRFRGRYMVGLEPDMTYGLFSRILDTARNAGFLQPFLMTHRKHSVYPACTGYFAINQHTYTAEASSVELSLALTSRGVSVRLGQESLAAGCKLSSFEKRYKKFRTVGGIYVFPKGTTKGKPPPPVKRLLTIPHRKGALDSRAVATCLSRIKKLVPGAKRLYIAAEPALKIKQVMALLEATPSDKKRTSYLFPHPFFRVLSK